MLRQHFLKTKNDQFYASREKQKTNAPLFVGCIFFSIKLVVSAEEKELRVHPKLYYGNCN